MTFISTELILVLQLTVGTSLQCQECRVCPLGYAYREHSVTASETETGNCMNYPNSLSVSAGSEDYINCTGTELTLTDSNLGHNDYISDEYYEWTKDESASRQLLFIFPTRVNLTTITLHYYSDSQGGLPPLRFYAVPDDFNVWDAVPGTNLYVAVAAVPLGEEPEGRNHVNTAVSFSTVTMKVLMVIAPREYYFTLSEVEFYKCLATGNALTIPPAPVTSTMSPPEEFHTSAMYNATETTNTVQGLEVNETQHNPGDRLTIPLVSTITVVLLAILVVLFILIAILHWHKQKRKQQAQKDSLEINTKQKNEPCSTFQREEKQPLEIPYDASALYDQIHLSPCTGQSEVVSETMHKSAASPMDAEYAECKGTENSTEALETENVLGSPVYAVVDKKKKKKTTQKKPKETESDKDTCESQVNLEEMYAVVNKKPKKKKQEQQETPPPIPEQTVEALYTAVQK